MVRNVEELTAVAATTTTESAPSAAAMRTRRRNRSVRRNNFTLGNKGMVRSTAAAALATALVSLQTTRTVMMISAFDVNSRGRIYSRNVQTTCRSQLLRRQQHSILQHTYPCHHRHTLPFSPYAAWPYPSTAPATATTFLAMSSSSSSSLEQPRTGAEENQHPMNVTDYSEIWSSDNDDDDDDNIMTLADHDNEEDEQDSDDDDDDDDENPSEWMEMYEQWMSAVDGALKILKKKQTSLESEWSKAQDVETTVKRAQLLVSNLYLFTPGVTTATVVDWEAESEGDEDDDDSSGGGGVEVTLTLNTKKYDSASAEADALFAQARKLKRGSQVISQLLEETNTAKEILGSAQLDLQSVVDTTSSSFDEGRFGLVKDRLIRTASTTNFQIPSETSSDSSSSKQQRRSSSSGRGGQQQQQQRRERKPEIGTPASNVRKLTSPGGCTVLVGRNRRGNEHLSLSIARGNDVWMHSRGCPGAHVVIMNRRGGPKMTDECLQFGADLAIFYSDLRNEKRAEVSAVEPKHILKPRG
eukprot:CAMPEP_0113489154 /NCGR_PEP_ID=MMETSP0014_2-20120614/26384_1 /TAXON_ID=2857 /ORGANISM="Nitzschia sp." /LENGTH=526 /DNA_ID=CAMNT_0000382885 /DNA_START=247 /DNA_END=1823 /DNA_ORIENTATION=+ /assembly_acc=CAM_ASM_000159